MPPETYTDQILTVHPSELSSQVSRCPNTTPSLGRDGCSIVARPFNFADFQGPVPEQVYFADYRRKALFNGVSDTTIVEGNYWPTLSLPAAITSINPSLFKSCKIKMSSAISSSGKSTGSSLTHPGILDPPVTLRALNATTLGAPFIDLPTPIPPQNTAYPAANGLTQATKTSNFVAPTATIITLKSTMATLPTSLLVQIGSQSLGIGGGAITLGDKVISRAADGNFILESHSTYYHTASSNQLSDFRGTVTTSTITALPPSLRSLVGSRTLHPGSAITIDDTVISLKSDGTYIVESTSSLKASEEVRKAAATSRKTSVGVLNCMARIWLYVSASVLVIGSLL
jgi:hypothetical protein